MKLRVLVLMTLFLSSMTLAGASCPKKNAGVSAGVPGGARDLYMQAEKYFEAGDYEAAQGLYQQVMEQYPGSDWADKAQFRIGQCYFKQGKKDDALSTFKQYVDNNRDESDVAVAQDYVIKILENELADASGNYERDVAGYQQQNFRYEMMNKYLRKSVDSEVIYLELDLSSNRLFVKLGTQSLYEYPVVSGKGRRTLSVTKTDEETEETTVTTTTKDFSTPKGIRQVESIEKDPKWYRPDWVWMENGEEVPEDLTMEDRAVEGVLGPYKISIGEGYYLHGTRRGKIRPGKYSHGCVRLNNDDLRQLVKLIEEGTVVYIY